MKRLALWNVRFAVTAMVVTLGLLAVYRSNLPPQVPLWYSLPWGEEQLASPGWLWLVPGLIGVVATVTFIGGKQLSRDELLASLWMAGGLVVQLVLALAVVRIVWLVLF